MLFEHVSYRTYLKAVLAERVAQNPRYSLRSLARQLELSPAILSQAMNQRRNLSPRMALKVAQNLKLPAAETGYFCLLTQYESEKHPTLKSDLHARLEQARQQSRGERFPRDLSVEMFKLISDWYHLPIVEMTELKGFRFGPAGVAKRLGISRNEAEVAIERLERLGLIEKNARGRYVKTNADYDFGSPFMNEALNKFHKQMLARAMEAVTAQKREERQIYSNTLSIDVRLLPRAAELVQKFRRDLVELFNASEENSQTYHLGIQFFRLTDLQPETLEAKQ